ncbi:MAG: acyltransferase domain-containing protein [Rudaea sp.]|nr:acyltransferase domain-containing protein [Rudaea sp.]
MNTRTSIAFLFPGQGAQRAGMLARVRNDPIAAATFDEAQDVLGRDLATLDTAAALAGTQATQTALLIAGIAGARQLEHQGIIADYVAGHSVGAFAAAAHAQVFSFADALRLVELRGCAMAQAFPHGYGMAVIAGEPESSVQTWIDVAAARGATLYISNRNAPDQLAVSGADADLAWLIGQARAHGARTATRLAVAVPSHSPLMCGVAAQLRDALRSIKLDNPRMPYVANHSARVLSDARAIADDLAEGVARHVLWHEATTALFERGVRTFVEMPPGDTLTRLAQAAFSEARAVALETAGLEGVLSITQHPDALAIRQNITTAPCE